MFAVAEVVTGTTTLPVVLPAAVRSNAELGTDRVFVVSEGIVEERLVQAEPTHEGLIAIRAGLHGGERLVMSPALDLRDGQRVE